MMPFAGGIEGTSNATLVFSIAAAIGYAMILGAHPTLLRSAVKTLAVALLAVLVLVERGPMLLLAVALALSAAGDAFLSRDGDTPFMAGLGSFLAAHLVYITLFFMSGSGVSLFMAEPARALAAGLIVLFALAMLVLLWRRVNRGLRLPIAAYAASIAGMGLAALSQPSLAIVGGALLFIASDGILAWEKFVASAISPHRDWMRHAVWLLYYAAQLSITLGFLLR